jgi:hypothetical protein
MKKRLLFLLLAMAAGAGCAPSNARPEASADKATPLEYRSAFDGYRGIAEDKLLPWREANETVKDAGDHAGHAAKPEAKPAAELPAKPPSGQEHRGHQ